MLSPTRRREIALSRMTPAHPRIRVSWVSWGELGEPSMMLMDPSTSLVWVVPSSGVNLGGPNYAVPDRLEPPHRKVSFLPIGQSAQEPKARLVPSERCGGAVRRMATGTYSSLVRDHRCKVTKDVTLSLQATEPVEHCRAQLARSPASSPSGNQQ